jgi:hypothetical protein
MIAIHKRLSRIGGHLFYTSDSHRVIFEEALAELHNVGNSNEIIITRGSRMMNLQGMYEEISAAWQFPYYFGYNAPGLVDCMSDLSWLPGTSYVLIVHDAHLLLSSEPIQQFSGLLGDFEEIVLRWHNNDSLLSANGQATTDFFVIFQTPMEMESAFLSRVRDAGTMLSDRNKISFSKRETMPERPERL